MDRETTEERVLGDQMGDSEELRKASSIHRCFGADDRGSEREEDEQTEARERGKCEASGICRNRSPEGHSPEQVAGELLEHPPDDVSERVCMGNHLPVRVRRRRTGRGLLQKIEKETEAI